MSACRIHFNKVVECTRIGGNRSIVTPSSPVWRPARRHRGDPWALPCHGDIVPARGTQSQMSPICAADPSSDDRLCSDGPVYIVQAGRGITSNYLTGASFWLKASSKLMKWLVIECRRWGHTTIVYLSRAGTTRSDWLRAVTTAWITASLVEGLTDEPPASAGTPRRRTSYFFGLCAC
jgi:hypothetical protein